jgi:hypothetical protein
MSGVKTTERYGVGVTLDCMLGTPGSNLGLSLAIKTEIFVIFLSTKQENAWLITSVRHDLFLPHTSPIYYHAPVILPLILREAASYKTNNSVLLE